MTTALIRCPASSVAEASIAVKVSNSKTIWSDAVVYVSKTSITESVSIWWPASVLALSVPSKIRLSTSFPLTKILASRAGAKVNVICVFVAAHCAVLSSAVSL